MKALLDKPNHAVLSTLAADGTVHSTVVWVDAHIDRLAQKYLGVTPTRCGRRASSASAS